MTAKPVDVRGRRVLVYSMGMEGRDLASWFLANGASVTMSDTRSPELLERAGASAPEGVERIVTGEPLLAPDGFEIVAPSQSVLRHDPAIVRARELGIPVVSQMQLFLELCPAPVVGITGSSGKSTTTSLVAAMAASAGRRHIVGGNIGAALLGQLGEIGPSLTVILEISHTQLQYTTSSPSLAAVTNVTPNHLDQFDWPDYVALKRHIFEYQGLAETAVINLADDVSGPWAEEMPGHVFRADVRRDHGSCGAWLDGATIMVRTAGQTEAVLEAGELQIRGAHNVANAVMAAAIGASMGLPPETMAEAAKRFRGVPHRLEVVGTAAGATWVNDSIATAPERTMAGLRAFDEPVVLLLGGREKNLPLAELASLAAERCRAVIFFGESGPSFHAAIGAGVPRAEVVQTLDEAVALAATLVLSGDAVLLSPAGTSFDAYATFEARGAAFRTLVRSLPGFVPPEAP